MLSVLTLKQCEEWDKIVRSFPEYDVYWLSGYVKAFELNGDGEPMLFYYNDGAVRGINVVMKRDIAETVSLSGKIEHNKFYDFVTPYGYGGWLIEGDNPSELFGAYEAWCRNHGVVCEFVRFHTVLQNHLKAAPFYEVIGLGNTISMNITSAERIWDNLTSKNRNMIRKAGNSGLTVFHSKSPEIYDAFVYVYNETMRRNHVSDYYLFSREFYDSIRNDLSENATVFYAQKNGVICSASIMIYANNKMNYHLSGTLEEYRKYAPGNLLLYKAALWGSRMGMKSFHLGGGVGSQNDSLYHFKKQFYRGEPLRYHIGKKVFSEEIYRHLVVLSHADTSSGFFPAYRA